MPEDCGHLEKYFENALRNMQMNAGAYMKYTRVCPYCRTDPKKDTCVNCGAPQEVLVQKNNFFISEPGEILKFRNVGIDPSEWT